MERSETVTEEMPAAPDAEDLGVPSDVLDIVLSVLSKNGGGSVTKEAREKLEADVTRKLFVQFNPIRVLRMRGEISQKVLADDSDCSHVTLGQFECGKSLPRISQLYCIAAALGEDPATLAFKYMSWYAHLTENTFSEYMSEPYTEGGT